MSPPQPFADPAQSASGILEGKSGGIHNQALVDEFESAAQDYVRDGGSPRKFCQAPFTECHDGADYHSLARSRSSIWMATPWATRHKLSVFKVSHAVTRKTDIPGMCSHGVQAVKISYHSLLSIPETGSRCRFLKRCRSTAIQSHRYNL